MIDLNEEQRITVAILKATGCPVAERLVRADPLTATLVGSELRPILKRLIDAVEVLLDAGEQL